MTDPTETMTDPEEIVVMPLSELPPVRIKDPGTPSGLMEQFDLPNPSEQRLTDPANSTIQQSGPSSGRRTEKPKNTGIAFSGGGIRSAAFCSGALRRMIQKDVPMDYLSCVSGGGYTGAAFLDWKYRETKDGRFVKQWYEDFFDQMREKSGYICNWQTPCSAICQSLVFITLLIVTVLILPGLLWLPYSLPVAVVIDFLFGDILREGSSCTEPVKPSLTRSSYLMMELYDNCSPPFRRVVLFVVTFVLSLVFYILRRCKICGCCQTYRGYFRLGSTLAGLFFAFTAFPWLAHDFLWPSETWIRVVAFFILLVLPFFFPVIRNYAAIFLFFYAYSYIISWKVFKTELFGKVPYSDEVFYMWLAICSMTFVVFPFLGSLHQALFNVYYRSRLSKAFFKSGAKIHWEDVFPWGNRAIRGISDKVSGIFRKRFKHQMIPSSEEDDETKKEKELTLADLDGLSPTFISNITVNDWQIESREGSRHHLMAFSPTEVKVIGKYVDEDGKTVDTPDFRKRNFFHPRHMRLSSAMAISGAAVSFDMGSFENSLDMVMDLLSLLGIGMGDEKVSDQVTEEGKGVWKKFFSPWLTEIFFCLPLIAVFVVYLVELDTDLIAWLVVLHAAFVVFLAFVAVQNTGSSEQGDEIANSMGNTGSSEQGDETANSMGNTSSALQGNDTANRTGRRVHWDTLMGYWSIVVRWLIMRVFFVRFLRGFLNISNFGTHPPPVLRLSDGGHFENLALLPLLEKKLKKIVIVDGSRNGGGVEYAKALRLALKEAREKLHCSFYGVDGRDIDEDIRVKFLTKNSDKRLPRHYEFRVHYYDNDYGEPEKGEVLFIAPRHPREHMPLKTDEISPVTEEPKKWKDFDLEALGKKKNREEGLESKEGEADSLDWGEGPELTEDEADRLTWCCCVCCHKNVKTCHCCCDCCCDCCHCTSSFCLGKFPHHSTGNQFFTPDMFSAYHREGYAACVEAKIEEFLLPDQSTEES